MRCPKCGQEDFFEVEAWEVTSYTAYLNNVDIESTKYNDTLHVALEPDSYASCQQCGHGAPLTDFGPSYPFPILKRPDFELGAEGSPELSGTARAIRDLLNCTDLNLDDLDETSVAAIEGAKRVIGRSKGATEGGGS